MHAKGWASTVATVASAPSAPARGFSVTFWSGGAAGQGLGFLVLERAALQMPGIRTCEWISLQDHEVSKGLV